MLPLHLFKVEQRHQPATSFVLLQRENTICLQTFMGGIQVDFCVLRCLLVPSAFARLARLSAGRSTAIRTGSAEDGLCKSGDAGQVSQAQYQFWVRRGGCIPIHVARSFVSGLDASRYLVKVSKQIRPRRQTSVGMPPQWDAACSVNLVCREKCQRFMQAAARYGE
jgi:hypothetical protein